MKSYAEIKEEVIANSARDWFYALDNMDKCADREHTVVHLAFSTCWLFTTGLDCRWSMDPAPRSIADLEVVGKIAKALSSFDFCVLTHLHADHYDKRIVSMMGESRTLRWVLPEFMAARVIEECGLDASLVTILKTGESFEHKGIRLTAYPGLHGERRVAVQVPEASFLAELPDGLRLSFPVDVRDYHHPVPRKMLYPDWLFSHLWLGRNVSHLTEFPMLDDFCRFNLKFRARNVLVGHLNETGRVENSMWTYRHWNLVRKRMHELSPKTRLFCPRNGSAFILTRQNPPDYFEDWNEEERQRFADNLGISMRGDIRVELKAATEQGVKAVEFRYDVFTAMNRRSLYAAVRRWREAGGKCLSLHLSDFSLDGDDPKLQWNVKCLGVDRVTEHVPHYSVEYMRENRQAVLRLFEKRLKPMIDQGVAVGIENLHTKPGKPFDKQRRYGLTIEEWLEFVHALRDRLGDLVGCHLDLGHAYTNYPFHLENTLDAWLSAGGELINGIHLHQYETDRSPENPYPDGHHPITGRNAGFPLLAPLFQHWQNRSFQCPMFIEMRPRYQPFALISRQRLLDAWEK